MLKRTYTIFIHVLALCGIYALVSSRLKAKHSPEQSRPIAKVEEERKPGPTYPLLRLYQNDPLYKWLRDDLRLSNVFAVFLVVAFVAICNLAIGFIAGTFYQGSGQGFHDHKLYLLGYDFLIIPAILYLYLWQPRAIAKVFKGLEQNGVIGDAEISAPREVQSYPEYRAKVQITMDKWQWSIIALIGTASYWGRQTLFAWPSEFARLGGESYWFAVKWYLPIHLLSFFPFLYALIMFVLREILAVICLNRLFQWFEVQLQPMHPDDSGGLGPLGAFTAQSTLVAVALGGIAIMVVVLITLLYRRAWPELLTAPDIFLSLGLYIVLVPACLILPMWSAHGAMVETRDEELERIAREIKRLLQESQRHLRNPELLESSMANLSKLRSQYEAILEMYPTWPIPIRIFRNVSITATIPVLSGLVPVVVRIISEG